MIEEIVVTGTRIKRRDFFTPSPLITISQDSIDFNGLGTIEEMLNRMPQVAPSFGRTSNNPGDGRALVDLRALGPERTLMLLNGRRFGSSAVDLNNIPQFLIDRVEIITGGTSAVYGSDALAGVVNFIIRDDLDGFGFETGMSMAEPGDSETFDASVAYGTRLDDGRINLVLFANWYERKSLMASERAFSRVAYIDDWSSGELVQAGSSRIPEGLIIWPQADLGNGPVQVTFDPNGTPREFDYDEDNYNYAPANYLQVPLERRSAGLFAQIELSDRLEAYLEASFTRNEPRRRLAPVPADIIPEVNLDNPVLAPETRQLFADSYACGPNSACFYFRRRMEEIGPRDTMQEKDLVRATLGFSGDLGGGWEFDAWYTYYDLSETSLRFNVALASRMEQGLLVDPVTGECYDPAGGCVPLNLFGEGNLSREGAEFLRVPALRNTVDATNRLASAFVRGAPFATWAGPVETAFGAEWRRTEHHFRPDTSIDADDAVGWDGDTPIHGTDEVSELYVEAVIPLALNARWAEYLGFEIGGRISSYSLIGDVWTYKAGGEWQPMDALRFRAMRQHSVRAPNAGELFEEQSEYTASLGTMPDPCSASNDPVGSGIVDKCVLQGLDPSQVGVFEATSHYPVTFVSGGNPDLDPEEADTWTAGLVYTPFPHFDLTLAIDYFDIELSDTIGDIIATSICFDEKNSGNAFCSNISRDQSGNVAMVTELTSNRGLADSSGIDVQIDFRSELPDWLAPGDRHADINVNMFWTHLLEQRVQENVVTKVFECAGRFGWPCWGLDQSDTFPRNRVTTNFHYTSGPLTVHLTWRWIQGTESGGPLNSEIWGFTDPNLAIPSIDNEQYLDLGLAYRFARGIQVRFGVDNLLDNDPPQMADQQYGGSSDYGMYDVFGRTYFLGISGEF